MKRRLLALLLCISLIGSMTVYATEAETTAPETTVPETTEAVQPQTQETTKATETTVPETTTEPTVPETSSEPTVPETTKAAEPTVPEATKAPEPTVPETTKAAEPTVPETSAPLVMAPAPERAAAAKVAQILACTSVEEMYQIILDLMFNDPDTLLDFSAEEIASIRARVAELDPEGDDTDTADLLDTLAILPNGGEELEGDPEALNTENWNAGAGDLTSGTYTLGADKLMTGTFNVKSDQNVIINLNGNALITKSGYRAFYVYSGGTLTIRDGDTTTKHYGSVNSNGQWVYNASATSGTLIQGGVIVGNAHNATDNISNSDGGAAICIQYGGTVNFEGGTIAGSRVNRSTLGHGGAIRVYGTLNMKGGSIRYCSVTQNGGAIDIYGDDSSKRGVVNMSAGVIADCRSDGGLYGGGAIGVGNYARFTMTGGTIENCYSAKHGGAIYTEGTVVIQSGMLLNNEANNYGNTIYMSSANVTIGLLKCDGGDYSDHDGPAYHPIVIDVDGGVGVRESGTYNEYCTGYRYKVAFNGNSSTSGSKATVTLYKDHPITLTNSFSRTGYTFTGWNTKADGTGTAYNTTTAYKNLATKHDTTVTLYAQWKINSYTVTVKAGTGIASVSGNGTYNYGSSVTINATLKTGYHWGSWSGTHSTTTQQYTFKMPANNVTDTANAVANTYTVKFNGNGHTGGSTADQSFTYDTAQNLRANGFTKTGYTFAGWAESANGAVKYTNSANVKNLTATHGGTVTLYAQWTADTYTVKYNGNNNTGGSTAASTHTYDTAKNLTANGFTRTGYTFKNWNTKADGTGTSYADKASVKNLATSGTFNLYAQWTPISYTIEYNGNGSTGGSTTSSTHTYDVSKALTANGFSRTGYTFTGWNTKADGTGTAYGNQASVKNLANTNGAKVTLYAQWKVNSYTVTVNAGTGIESVTGGGTYNYGTNVSINATLKPGYLWSGWTTGESATSTQNYSFTMPAKNVTYTANATPITYTVKYNANTGTGTMDNSTHTYDAAKNLTTNAFTKTGYTFAGWATSANGSVVYQDKESVSNLTTTNGETVNLYAVWTPNADTPYVVNHWQQNIDGGAEQDGTNYTKVDTDNLTGTSDSKVTPAVKTYKGFTAPTAMEVTIAADGSLVVDYYYTRNSYAYTFKFLEKDSDPLKTLETEVTGTAHYGKSIEQVAKEIPGYTLDGEASASITIDTDVTKNEYTFWYTENQTTITYVALTGGSVDPTSETLKVVTGTASGSTATPDDKYDFVGWYADEACNQPVPAEYLDGNKIIPVKEENALWTEVTYYAKFRYTPIDLTINKSITGGAKPDQDFLFKVSGQGVEMTVVIPASKFVNGEASIVINDLPAGQYTVTELNWAWRYSKGGSKTINSTTTQGNDYSVSFENSRINDLWLDAIDWIENVFSVKSGN